jgi:hypothetical protein
VLYITQTIGLKITSASNSGFITGLSWRLCRFFHYALSKKPSYFGFSAVALSLAGLGDFGRFERAEHRRYPHAAAAMS